MQVRRNINKFWTALCVGCMLGVLVLSLLPYVEKETKSLWQEILHNLLHIPAYAILTFFLIQMFSIYKVKGPAFKLSFVTSFVYGALIEVLQGFVPGRSPSLLDLCLNTVGIFIAIYIYKKRYLRIIHNNA